MIRLLLLAVTALIPTMAFAELQTGPIDYKSQDTVLEGYVAYNKSLEGKRPGVVLVPDWMGVAEHYNKIADKLADLGYVPLLPTFTERECGPRMRKKPPRRQPSISRTVA